MTAVQNPGQSLSNSNQELFKRIGYQPIFCHSPSLLSGHQLFYENPPIRREIFELWKRKIWTAIWPFPKGRLPIVGRWPLTSGVHPIMAVGHLFQTYLPDNKSLTQFLGQRVQAGRETDLWNGAIWGQRHLHSARTRSCSAHIYRCPLCFFTLQWPWFPDTEERKHSAVLSGTCGVQNAVITNSGRPIYVTRPAWSWWTPAYCLYSTLPASYIWHRCNQPGRTQHLLSNAGVPKFSIQVI